MARFVSDNPTNSRTLTLSPASIVISATAADGIVTTGASVAALERGQSVILTFTGGTAQGYTTLAEYFVIPIDSTHFAIASTKANAQNSIVVATTGNAGAGVIYPVFPVGGVLYVGTGGDLNCRGSGVRDIGASSFSLMKNVMDGSAFPFMIKDVCSLNTSCDDLVCWCD